MTEFLQSFIRQSLSKHYLIAVVAGAGLICAGCNGGSTAAPQNASAALPMMSIENASALEGDAGISSLVFDVTLSAAASAIITACRHWD